MLKAGGHESEHKGAKHPYLQKGVKSELVIKIVFYYVLVFTYALTFSPKNILLDKKFMCNFRNCLGQIRINLESSWQLSVIEVKILPMF
jgi:hypothetical protein